MPLSENQPTASRTGRRPGRTRPGRRSCGRRASLCGGWVRPHDLSRDRRRCRRRPALVVQFFGSKQELFAAATVRRSRSRSYRRRREGPGGGAPVAPCGLLMQWLEDEGARQALLGRIRGASSEPAAADAVREMIGAQLSRFAQLMDGEGTEVRASLLATQFLGVVFARFIVRA